MELGTKNCAVYVILRYDIIENVVGIRIGESEEKHYRIRTFDELKGQDVEDVQCHHQWVPLRISILSPKYTNTISKINVAVHRNVFGLIVAIDD